MNMFWIVSYIVLWLLVIVLGLVILALSKEVETLHRKLEEILAVLASPSRGMNREQLSVENSREVSKVEK
jgi:hypothetical protein